MKLTNQETNIINFLQGKSKVAFEELAQFTKEPTKVKLKTIKKIISDIKKKHKDNNIPLPFNCEFYSLITNQKDIMSEKVIHNQQTLVKLERKKIISDPTLLSPHIQAGVHVAVQAALNDFSINKFNNQVLSKSGWHTLNEDDFQIFQYFFQNIEKIITLEELRDKVVFPLYGSKMPARWFSTIQRRINNIRKQIPETKNRLLTIKLENSSGYMLK